MPTHPSTQKRGPGRGAWSGVRVRHGWDKRLYFRTEAALTEVPNAFPRDSVEVSAPTHPHPPENHTTAVPGSQRGDTEQGLGLGLHMESSPSRSQCQVLKGRR